MLRLLCRLRRALVLLLASLPLYAQAVTTLHFQEGQALFPNPERGWIVHRFTDNLWGLDTLRNSPEQISTILLKVDLSDYRNAAHIGSSKLNEIASALAQCRAMGYKALIRPAYSWTEELAPDPADLNIIRNHVLDLKPLFHEYKDVLVAVEMGMFGPWGEMHSSSHSTRSDVLYYPVATAALRTIHEAYMEALPADRMVLVRRPFYIRQLFGDSPLDSSQAYSGSAQARTGYYNDAYLVSADDGGTFAHGWSRQQELNYVGTMSQQVFFGGESFGTPNGPYNNATNAYNESRQQHMTYLHRDYSPAVYNAWGDAMKANFTRELGYRLVLRSLNHTGAVPPGGGLQLEISLENVGFSSLHNPRPVELVLERGNQQLRTSISVDPRDWNPEAGVITFERWFHLPANMSEGSWHVYLALPDASSELRQDGRFAVRFANTGTWDARGLNLLIPALEVAQSAPGDRDTDTGFYEFDPIVPPALGVASPQAERVGTDLILRATYTGAPDYRQAFIDWDGQTSSGYSAGNVGADWLVENGRLYQHLGEGWNWGYIGEVEALSEGSTTTWTLPLSYFSDNGASAQIAFAASNGSDVSYAAPIQIKQPDGLSEGIVQLQARHSGLQLRPVNGSSAASAALEQWAPNSSDNQRFELRALGNGEYELKNRSSGMCLDVDSFRTDDGAPILQWHCHNGVNQRWVPEEVEEGWYLLRARHSNKCMDVFGAGTNAGARIIQWSCHGGPNQQWRIQSN